MCARQRARLAVIAASALVFVGGVGAPVLRAGQDVCNCPHVGDANGNGVASEISDMVFTINNLFSGAPIQSDADCPRSRSDYNADGIVDVRDVTALIDDITQGGSPPTNPCDCLINPPVCAPVIDPSPGSSGNTVFVESKEVVEGQTGVPIRIRLSNTATLRFIVIPLVARSIDPGAFITSVQMTFSDRLSGTALSTIQIRDKYANPDGTCGPQGFGTITSQPYGSNPPFLPVTDSPEGFLFAAGDVYGQPTDLLSPGVDVSGSLVLTVDVTNSPGAFEIDTTCTNPANHLEFVQNNPPTNSPIVPAFTKGTITIVANTPPVAQCRSISVSAGAGCAMDASVNNGSYDPDGGPVTIAQVPPGPYLVGVTNVTLTVTDNAGAAASCQATVTVTDNTPPVITCPIPIATLIGPSDSGAVVNYVCTATDNCPGVSIVCSPPSGSFFRRGMTAVTCIATDAAGLADTCHFTVAAISDCFDRMSDVNCDGIIDVKDVILMINVTFNHAAQVPCPVPK